MLARNGHNMLLISKYALDCQPYNLSKDGVTWETSSMRKWLNNSFLNDAFSVFEFNMIQNTSVSAHSNPRFQTTVGNNTKDKVFLLSIREANMYFNSDDDRLCEGTDYCKAQGANIDKVGNCTWWLRSPGNSNQTAAHVKTNGSVGYVGDSIIHSDYTVRPALFIYLES